MYTNLCEACLDRMAVVGMGPPCLLLISPGCHKGVYEDNSSFIMIR